VVNKDVQMFTNYLRNTYRLEKMTHKRKQKFLVSLSYAAFADETMIQLFRRLYESNRYRLISRFAQLAA